MREKLFKGKRTDNGEWVYGYYVCLNGKSHRIYTGYAETDCGSYYPDFYEVVPESVSEFTGLTDKNGKKIFEGDIVRYNVWHCNPKGTIQSVEWVDVCCGFEPFSDSKNNCGHCGGGASSEDSEVIGNIHDNPELLGGD